MVGFDQKLVVFCLSKVVIRASKVGENLSKVVIRASKVGENLSKVAIRTSKVGETLSKVIVCEILVCVYQMLVSICPLLEVIRSSWKSVRLSGDVGRKEKPALQPVF